MDTVNLWLTTRYKPLLNPIRQGEFRNVTELVSQEDGTVKCPYCNAIYRALIGLYQHIRFRHHLNSKQCYDNLCKRRGDGICIICFKPTEFKSGGYLLTCSPECKAKWVSIDEARARKISRARLKYNTESFIEKARSIHGELFDYSHTEMRSVRDSVSITCRKHGQFDTIACYHLENMWGGCRKCAAESMIATKAAWSDEKKEEVKNTRRKTNKKKFGYEAGPNPFGSDSFANIMIDKFGVENPFSSEEIKEKIKKTNLEKYGVENPAYLEKTIKASHTKQANRKRYITHKKNNSFTASQPEDDFHEFLLSIFDADDVFRHYADDPRYPFACDFYIRSLDLFIELNLYFTHGFHWFNHDDPEDLKKLAMWKERSNGKDLYNGAIYVWTVSDPQKREAAIRNNLNYVVLWNLKDIERYKNELIERFVLK